MRRWSIDIDFSVELGDENQRSVTLVVACLPWHNIDTVCPTKLASLMVFANRSTLN